MKNKNRRYVSHINLGNIIITILTILLVAIIYSMIRAGVAATNQGETPHDNRSDYISSCYVLTPKLFLLIIVI